MSTIDNDIKNLLSDYREELALVAKNLADAEQHPDVNDYVRHHNLAVKHHNKAARLRRELENLIPAEEIDTPAAVTEEKTPDHEFATNLLDFITDNLEDQMNYGEPIANVRSFEDAEIMTYNAGLVVTLEDGSEYQLTIVRSK